MGMSRSKINRDKERIDSLEKLKVDPKLIKANLTIKRLKHSLSMKDKKIKEMNSELKGYEEIIRSFKEHQDYMNFILNFNKRKEN